MAVYVDDMLRQATVPNGARTVSARWSHLSADTDDELHAFAQNLGLRRSWAQYPGTWKSHYDVTESMRTRALKAGAIPIRYGTDSVEQGRCKRAGRPYEAPGQHELF